MTDEELRKLNVQREIVLRNNPFNWKNGFNPAEWQWQSKGVDAEATKRFKERQNNHD
jgi:hypothetical protein